MNYQTERAIENILDSLAEYESELDAVQKKIDKAKAELMGYLEKNELDTVTVGEEGSEIKVTVVRPTQLKIDENGLESSVSEAIWRSITKRIVDKKALEDAVARGKVEPSVISKHSKEVATKPYLRITR